MDIPVYKFPVCIDFSPFMDQLEAKYGWNYRDMAGKFSKETRAKNAALKKAWLEANDYADKAYVLDVPNPANQSIDWPTDSPEMKLRIKINSEYRSSGAEAKEIDPPYQDVWHWMVDIFGDFSRGSIQTLPLDYWINDEETPDYVKTVLKAIKEEVKDHPAYDGDGVNFYIDW